MRAALTEIGFSKIETALFDQRWHVDSVAQVLDAMRGGTVRARALLAAQSEIAATRIQQYFEETLSGMRNPAGGFDVPLPALIGSGMKP